MDEQRRRASDGAYHAGDAAYFERMYEQYATDVLRVSYFYLGDRQKAEDVCQDVFVRLITNTPVLPEGKEKASAAQGSPESLPRPMARRLGEAGSAG